MRGTRGECDVSDVSSSAGGEGSDDEGPETKEAVAARDLAAAGVDRDRASSKSVSVASMSLSLGESSTASP